MLDCLSVVGYIARKRGQAYEGFHSQISGIGKAIVRQSETFCEESSRSISIICLLSASIANCQSLPQNLGLFKTQSTSHTLESRPAATECNNNISNSELAFLVIMKKSTEILFRDVEKLIL